MLRLLLRDRVLLDALLRVGARDDSPVCLLLGLLRRHGLPMRCRLKLLCLELLRRELLRRELM